MTVNETLDLFVYISALFRARFQKPLWEKYPGYLEDSVKAVLVFLEGYAFERQGRNPAYAHVAVEAIARGITSPQGVWDRFVGLLGGQRLNRKLNPLFHNSRRCSCIWCATGPDNIIVTAKTDVAEGHVKEAWHKLKEIRGVGPKIASLFLRDVVVQFDLNPASDYRWLLQPVDVWVRRGVAELMGKEANDKEVAKWVVANCRKPEAVNQGLWYFGAQIAGSDFRLKKSINNLDYAKEICREHVSGLKATVEAIRAEPGYKL